MLSSVDFLLWSAMNAAHAKMIDPIHNAASGIAVATAPIAPEKAKFKTVPAVAMTHIRTAVNLRADVCSADATMIGDKTAKATAAISTHPVNDAASPVLVV